MFAIGLDSSMGEDELRDEDVRQAIEENYPLDPFTS
jgi:hypothetical protein